MRTRLGAIALVVAIAVSPAHAQRPASTEDVTVEVMQRGDPARDCGCRGGVNNRRMQSDARPNRWACRDCRTPFRGRLDNAKVVQMLPNDRCFRGIRGTNRVRDAHGHRLTVRVSLEPIANYRFCLVIDGAAPKSFHITARPGRPYADPNNRSMVLVR